MRCCAAVGFGQHHENHYVQYHTLLSAKGDKHLPAIAWKTGDADVRPVYQSYCNHISRRKSKREFMKTVKLLDNNQGVDVYSSIYLMLSKEVLNLIFILWIGFHNEGRGFFWILVTRHSCWS